MVSRQVYKAKATNSISFLGRLSSLLIISVLFSCSSNSWVKSHPQEKNWRATNSPSAWHLSPDHFLITHYPWAAQTFHIREVDLQDSLFAFFHTELVKQLAAKLGPDLKELPPSLLDTFPEPESYRVSNYAYVRGQVPAQGQVIHLDNIIPGTIILIHEMNFGTDISKQTLYDYRNSQKHRDLKRKNPKTLGIAATWTLWDNNRQQRLRWGATDYSIPVDANLTKESMQILIQEWVQHFVCDLNGGC